MESHILDPNYLIMREQQELEAALHSSNLRVRRLHLEMADAYTCRISEINRREQLSTRAPVNDRAADLQAANAGYAQQESPGLKVGTEGRMSAPHRN